jgi:hypothetical protein
MNNIDISKLTLEQKVVLRLAELGYITSYGDIQRALNDMQYANYMISAVQDDGKINPDIDTDNDGVADENPNFDDIIANAPGVPECDGEDGDHVIIECDHEALTPEEIQEVFDNDNKKK